jgi:hypothetical protein
LHIAIKIVASSFVPVESTYENRIMVSIWITIQQSNHHLIPPPLFPLDNNQGSLLPSIKKPISFYQVGNPLEKFNNMRNIFSNKREDIDNSNAKQEEYYYLVSSIHCCSKLKSTHLCLPLNVEVLLVF